MQQQTSGFPPAGGSPGEPDAKPREQPRDPYGAARTIVLRQLTSAPKSRHQLAVKLAEKDIPQDVAQAVLDRFEEVRLVDDAEFARMWVDSRSRSKSLARGALKRELAEKGISGELAAEALEQVSDEDELEAARTLARRKLQPSVDLTDRAARDKQAKRLVSMLARKGYSPSVGYRVVNEIIGDVLEERPEDEW
ncbi:regulatory protein RecX [Arthrobacter sunyaminii]|uniref:Regulatory protein RecX n=1 Tax=Arthrobacter sunyaminii TaxID=2816859 RepID=A0A975S7Q3_9MICC|nr:regulatory protein RecX [Arthrobacter sunyaminii]QWQ37339.1 recombination regulator RecX [Arthrobacter sunyaminii]